MPVNKLEITRRLVEQLPDSSSQAVSTAMQTWWLNLRKEGGYRLTRQGYTMFTEVFRLTHWSADLKGVQHAMLLELDRKLEWPYYLDGKHHKIIFFSSREAMMATLYGDVKAWLSNLG